MRIAIINMVDYGSTGNIMLQIADVAREHGNTVKTFSKKWRKQVKKTEEHVFFGYTVENAVHVIISKYIGFQGLFSVFGTMQLIHKLKKFSPDIIHLHNLHDSCICFPLLFKYIGNTNIPVIWTLHDCWGFTGQCYHYVVEGCDKWRKGCDNCDFLFNKLHIDCTSYMWKKKRKSTIKIKKLLIVTPSVWLKNEVCHSMYKKRKIMIINNGIDLDIFHPVEFDFVSKYGCADKKIILAVASVWTEKKGLMDILELNQLMDNSKYQLVIVGTNKDIDRILPISIISIHRTSNQAELVGLYSAADVFINPTHEDTFPTTNIEALACGTPVVTYNTGGSAEIINNQCGAVVDCGNVYALKNQIELICSNKLKYSDKCRNRALQYNKYDRYEEYVKLYEIISHQGERK